MFGRFFHLLVDAALVSMALSGIKRTTGLTPALSKVPSKDVRNVLRVYLETGEWVSRASPSSFPRETEAHAFPLHQLMDFSVVVLGRSSSFERIR
jgi:Fungal protein of unknown function (DUF1748)